MGLRSLKAYICPREDRGGLPETRAGNHRESHAPVPGPSPPCGLSQWPLFSLDPLSALLLSYRPFSPPSLCSGLTGFLPSQLVEESASL